MEKDSCICGIARGRREAKAPMAVGTLGAKDLFAASTSRKLLEKEPFHGFINSPPMTLPHLSIMSGQRTLLSDLPVEVLLDNIFPFVSAYGLLSLGCTNKFFSALCNDETLWKRKVLEDFNFSGEGTARTSGYQIIYRGLSDPKVFVWGEKSNGRLGRESIPKTVIYGVPYPIEIKLPGARVVSLVAGGMSYHALDSQGGVHVWGALDGNQFTGETRGFSECSKQASVPHKLKLPAPVRSISCGRLHSSCLDTDNKIWTFTNWGRPFYLSSPILTDPEYAAKQIECGWMFSSMLTKSGDVFVWWPFEAPIDTVVQQKMREMDNEADKAAHPDGTTIPCVPWGMDLPPTRLPPIPSLPALPDNGVQEEGHKTQLIQIASFENHIVGLTNLGHVLKFDSLHNETGVPHGQWEYLPKFSELRELAEVPAFSSPDHQDSLELPKTLKITHISANFQHFVAYTTGSSSIVLLGDTATSAGTQPEIIPELQNKSVISVVIGDYHNAALTADGKLFTWGGYSNGALGLGDPAHLPPGTPGGFMNQQTYQTAMGRGRGSPPDVQRPTEVKFDHEGRVKKGFCFAVTAAGWHTGALVIDLEPGNESVLEHEDLSSPNNEGLQFETVPSELPTFIPSIFRRGHAAASGWFSSGGGSST